VVGEQRLLVAGTHFEGVPRITRIYDFRVDMHPAGTFLVVQDEDRPGVIAAPAAPSPRLPGEGWGEGRLAARTVLAALRLDTAFSSLLIFQLNY